MHYSKLLTGCSRSRRSLRCQRPFCQFDIDIGTAAARRRELVRTCVGRLSSVVAERRTAIGRQSLSRVNCNFKTSPVISRSRRETNHRHASHTAVCRTFDRAVLGACACFPTNAVTPQRHMMCYQISRRAIAIFRLAYVRMLVGRGVSVDHPAWPGS